MTLEQLEERMMALKETIEERVAALEGAVEALRKQQPHHQDSVASNAEEMILGTEYPLVLSIPPAKAHRVQGRIRSISRGPQDLALTDEEWAMFAEGEDHGS
ncbi:MAG TPA: hypothetical protein VMF69_06555 [Gemmataceae bacterium]|nr:hypothetical protein [Gemmataceae bacterium]